MTRPAKLAAALAALLAAAGGLAGPAAARTDDLAKPVVLLVGPELEDGGRCNPLDAIARAIKGATDQVDGKRITFTGSVRTLTISGACESEGSTGADIDAIAATLAKRLSRIGAGKPIDVVAPGSAGLVLRYAMLMSARNRMGLTAFGETAFAKDLDIEDAVTLGTPHGGAPAFVSRCGASPICRYMGGAPSDAPGDVKRFWNLLRATDGAGTNPQGTGGTDWSVIGVSGDRWVSADTAVDMDAAHQTIYTRPELSVSGALTDTSSKRDQKIRFRHNGGDWTLSEASSHVVPRIVNELVRGGGGAGAAGGGTGAYAPGCTGSNEGTGETLIATPQLPLWTGDQTAVRVVRFATVDAVAQCFKERNGTYYSSRGPVRVNGIDLIPDNAGTEIVLDPKERRLYTRGGGVRVSLPLVARDVSVESFLVPSLSMVFPADGGIVQTDDGTRLKLEAKKLLGTRLKGGLSLSVGKGTMQIAGELTLPGVVSAKVASGGTPQCSNGVDDDHDGQSDLEDEDCVTATDDYENAADGVGAAVTLATSNRTGVVLDKLGGKVEGAFRIGSFRVEGGLAIDWAREDSQLKVTANATLPALRGVGAKVVVGMKGGTLTQLYVEASSLNIAIPNTALFLQRLGGGINGIDALGDEGRRAEWLLGLGVSLGPVIGGKSLFAADGDLSISFGTPWKWKLEGSASMAGETLGKGSLEYEGGVTKASVVLGGKRELSFNVTAVMQGTLTGALSLVDGSESIDLGAKVQACLKGEMFGQKLDDPLCMTDLDLRASKFPGSPFTESGCFGFSLPLLNQVRVGWVSRHPLGQPAQFEWIEHSCDVANVHGTTTQVRAAGDGVAPGSGFVIPAGTDKQVVIVRGTGGAPVVTLVAPDGRRIATPTDRLHAVGPDWEAITGLHHTTVVALVKPVAGTWRVEPVAGSPAVRDVRTADILPAPRVGGRVTRTRGRFVLHADVAAAAGQTVRFVERGAGVSQVLGVVRGGHAALRFTPVAAPGRAREVVAMVLQDGRPRAEVRVARFTAPGLLRPGRVRGVRTVRRGGRLVVTWRAAARAGGYAVEARLPGGRGAGRIVRPGRPRRVSFPAGRRDRVTLKLVALRRSDEAPGPATVVPAARAPARRR